MDSMTFRTTTLALAPCHHPTAGAASCIQPVVLRPLRTLNNIHQTLTPHVIQLRPESSPNLSGKRKTAVELLQESKAFYVKTVRVLDHKQELPMHGYSTTTTTGADRLMPGHGHGQLQLNPNRSPMLSLPSARIRDHYHEYPPPPTSPQQVKDDNSVISSSAAYGVGGGGGGNRQQQQREGYYTTPPVEKRRLSIRKDNPLPLNVTAVKRFLSRSPAATAAAASTREAENLQVIRAKASASSSASPSPSQQSSSSTKLLMGLFGDSQSSQQQQGVKKVKSRSAFSEVLPCICRQTSVSCQSDKMRSDPETPPPPQLPLRKTFSSPPPPLPPKSPALNAKLLLLSQERNYCLQQQQNTLNSRGVGGGDYYSSRIPIQQMQQSIVKENPPFRRFQSEETPNNKNSSSIATMPTAMTTSNGPTEAEFPITRVSLRHTSRHKSLPDLNSPKNGRRRGIYGRVDGKIRSASTDLDSDSASGRSSPISSSSVRLDSGGSTSSSDSAESCDDESETQMRGRGCRMPSSSGGAKSERATTSDYASRSPSFKYETASLVQTSQRWSLPPWQDDSGLDGPTKTTAMNDDVTAGAVAVAAVEPPITNTMTSMTTSMSAEQVRRRAILRSKSDVGPSRFAPDLLPAVPAEFTGDVPIDLDMFFDTIGESCLIASRPDDGGGSGRSSPVYFASVSSVDSCCKRRVHVDNVLESSDSEDQAATLQRRILGSQPGMGEPSIVERNARIIKWLIKCRNVPTVSIPISGSTGQLKLSPMSSHHHQRCSSFQLQQKLPSPPGATGATGGPPILPPPNKMFAAAITSFYGQSTRL